MKTTYRVILLGFLMFALAETAHAVAPVATTGTATNVTLSTATLRGKVNPKSLVTRVWFEWGTTTNYGAATTPTAIGNGNAAINFTRSISNLTAGAIYHFRIVGSNVSGTTRGADAIFLTMVAPLATITNCTEADLRAALNQAATIIFACDGVIVLANQMEITRSVRIDAGGHAVTISGGDSNRLFNVGAGASLHLINLTLAHGREAGTNSLVSGNLFSGLEGGTGGGGAIKVVQGSVAASACQFVLNNATGGNGGTNLGGTAIFPPGGNGLGGAILAESSTVQLTNCSFLANSASGGPGGWFLGPTRPRQGPTGSASGGALSATNSLVQIVNCSFRTNVSGAGGAIQVNGGSLLLQQSSLAQNRVSMEGGGILNNGASVVVAACEFIGNSAAYGGQTCGGGICQSSGSLEVSDSTFSVNTSYGDGFGLSFSGSPAVNAKNGLGGAVGIMGGTASLQRTTFSTNQAVGGWASDYSLGPVPFAYSAEGIGGALFSQGTVRITNCSFAQNAAVSGGIPFDFTYPRPDPAGGKGGAVASLGGTLQIHFSTIASNAAYCGGNHTNASYGGGIYNNGGTLLVANSILAGNTVNATNFANTFGSISDAGHNLSSDATPVWTSGTSLNNADPLLGPLGDYGGFTLTFPLWPGSPALNTADCAAAPATDQRGQPRPGGPGCDIGAYEGGGAPPSVLTAIPTDITTNSATLRGSVNPNSLASTVTFEWGTTTNYGLTTAIQSLAAGSAPVPVQASIATLTPLTTYHYRVVASSAAGVSVGEDILVTATELLTLYAGQSWTYEFHDLPFSNFDYSYPSIIGTSTIIFGVLPGTFPPGSALKYESFEQSTNDHTGFTLFLSANGAPLVSGVGGLRDLQGVVRLTMLTGSVVIPTISFYVNTGRSGNSASVYRNIIAPTTLPQPALIATQYVGSVGFQSAVVQANVNANNLVTGLSVQWGATTNYGSATGMASLNRDYLVWQQLTLTNLAPGTVYHARVVATNSGGTTYGEDLMFATPPPATVVTLPANNRQSASVDLNATVTGNGFATTAYFEWGATTNYDRSTPLQNLGSPIAPVGVSATVTGLVLQTVYHGRAVAYALGVTNRGEDVVFSTVSTPTNLVVTNCMTEDVRGAIERGGTVTFACDGVVVLSNQIEIANNICIDASGHTVVFSGNDTARIFKVLPGVLLTLTNLTLANGQSTNGGAIYNEGSVLAQDCSFLQNQAVGANGANGANGLPGTNSAIIGQSTPGAPGGTGGNGQDASGGAIHNSGQLDLARCLFADNQALGGTGGNGGTGGAAGVVLPCCGHGGAATGNGGAAGIGGSSQGGSIASFGILVLSDCIFSNSFSGGGTGGAGGGSGTTSLIYGGSGSSAIGGTGGLALGSAIYNAGQGFISNSTFAANTAVGGIGGVGHSRTDRSQWLGDRESGGGNGGVAFGGAIYNLNNSIVANCTFTANMAGGGRAGMGGQSFDLSMYGHNGNGGDGFGGVLANAGTMRTINLTLNGNAAMGGTGGTESYPYTPGTNGTSYGGSVANTGGVFQVVNSIIADGTSNNCYGVITDLGHNLSSDATPVWTSGTSLNNADPLLLPLANNGGPTLTMALGAGSPALDIADCAAAPATDQRGQPRPGGPGCDIGAYEGVAGVTPVFIARGNSATVVLRWLAEGGRTYRVEESANLNGWTPMSTNTAAASGWLELSVPANPSPRFFRLIAQ